MTAPEPTRAGPPPLVRVLGPCLVTAAAGDSVPLTGGQRRLVSCLALDAPRATGPDRLARAIWPEAVPDTARASLHNQVSRLRRLLGTGFIAHHADGYRLDTAVEIDATTLGDGLDDVETLLAEGEAESAFTAVDGLLDSWRGLPFADIGHLPEVAATRRSLDALRYTAQTLRLEAALAAGMTTWAVTEGDRLTAADPHDERRGILLARALHQQGRRADALATLESVRRAVRVELGLDPSRDLNRAEQAILNDEAPLAPASPTPPLVGRAEELDAAVQAVLHGGLVHLDGSPGIGVSTLLGRLRRRLGELGHLTVRVACPEFPASALTTIADILDELDGEPVRQGLIEGFRSVLEKRAAARPVTILVDDAQLAGPSTRRALTEAAELPGVSVLLAGHGIEPPSPGRVVRLGPLDAEALGRLVAAAGPDEADHADLVARVARLSGGNPLLARLVLADPGLLGRPGALDPTGAPAYDPQSPAGASPSGVTGELAGLVRHWRAALGPTENALLDWTSVLGQSASLKLLRSVLPSGAVPASAFLSVEAGEAVSFVQDAVRYAVYDALPQGRRTEMHHAVGLAADALGLSATTVAAHLWRAREAEPVAAREAAVRAAEEATLLGAHHDAAGWLHAALELADTLDEAARLRLRIVYGDALRLSGDPGHVDVALDALHRALDLDVPALIGEAAFSFLQLGQTSDFGGADSRIRRLTSHVLARLTEPEDAAPVLAAASLAWSMTAQASQARSLFERAERAATGPAARAKVLPFTYLALGLPGDLDRREALAGELRGIGEQLDDPAALFEAEQLTASIGMLRGDGARLRAASTRMDELLPRVGDVGRRWSALYTKAAIAHLDGDLEGSEALSLAAHELFAPVSPGRAAATYQAQLLGLWMAQGKVGDLHEVLGTMVAEQPGVPAWHAAYALALCEAGASGPELGMQLRATLDRAEADFTWLAAHVLGGRAAAAHGDPVLCGEYADRLAPWSGLGCWQGTCSYGPLDTTLALLARALGDTAGARRHVAIAVEVAERLQAPVFLADLRDLGLDLSSPG